MPEAENQTGGEDDPELDLDLDDTEGDDSYTEGAEGSTEGQDPDAASKEGKEGDVEGEGEDATAATDTAPQSRSSKRIQALREREAAATAEAKLLKERLEQVLAEQRKQPPMVDEAAARAEAERVAAMDPVERRIYESEKKTAALQAQVNGLGFHISDATDKARFEAKAEINPVYKKYADRIEKGLSDMRKNNANTTREALLTYYIGEDARKRLESKTGSDQRRRAAATRVERTQGRPATARSDVGGSRSDANSLAALEKRLAGVPI